MEKEFLDRVAAQTKEQVESQLKNVALKSDIENIISKAEETQNLTAKEIKDLKEIAVKQGEFLKGMKEEKSTPMGFDEFLSTQKDVLQTIKSGQNVEFTLKTTAETSIVTNSTINDRIARIAMPDLNQANLEALLPKYNLGSNNGGVRRYIDMTSYTSNADFKAEKAAMPEDAAAFAEYSIDVKKIGTTIPITEEFLYDYQLLASEIQNRLFAEMRVKIDNAILNGTGLTVNAKGLNAYASAYAAGGYAQSTLLPNIYDLIMVLKAQMSAGKSKYMPNAVILNPADVYSMMSAKNELGDYIKPSFVSPDYMTVGGVKIIESNAQTAGKLTILDTRFAELITAGDINIAVGYNLSEDFSKGILTVRAVKRMNTLVRNIDVTGVTLVDGIAAALQGLTKTNN